MTKPCQCEACRKGATAKTQDSVSESGFFTPDQIGQRQSLTPEGFLLCEAVPIARAGTQDYAAVELPALQSKDGVIVVERDPEVVFSPETMASFTGKAVTIDHPYVDVAPDNWSALAKGTAHNIRRGEGDQNDLLLADLLITDQAAIDAIQSKQLTQVSCGYDASYEQIAPGRARQAVIVGNHIALVKSARCGPVCSIGDSNTSFHQGADMAKSNTKKSGVLDALRKAFMTRDTDAFEQAAQEMTGDEGPGGDPDATHVHIHMTPSGASATTAAAGATTDEDPAINPADDPDRKWSEVLTKFDQRLTAIEGVLSKLQAGTGSTTDEDPNADPNGDPAATLDESNDDPNAGGATRATTGDSTGLRDEFQEAKALAEILAPGLRQPTFDAKAALKTTRDSLCVLRRRALRAALDGDNADLVLSVTGGADVSKLTCDSARMAFNAAAALVKQHNTRVQDSGRTNTTTNPEKRDINTIHRDFWANRT